MLQTLVRSRDGTLQRVSSTAAGLKHGRPRPKKTHAP